MLLPELGAVVKAVFISVCFIIEHMNSSEEEETAGVEEIDEPATPPADFSTVV